MKYQKQIIGSSFPLFQSDYEECPFVSQKCKKYDTPTKPRISPGILRSLQAKNLLFKKYTSEPNQDNKSSFVDYKKYYQN